MNMLDQRKFTGWPSRDCYPLMRLSMEPEELSDKFGIEFVDGRDDLDHFLAGHIFDEIIGFVVFIRHRNAPQSGTPVYVDSQVSSNKSIERLTKVLSLKQNQINWTRELVKDN